MLALFYQILFGAQSLPTASELYLNLFCTKSQVPPQKNHTETNHNLTNIFNRKNTTNSQEKKFNDKKEIIIHTPIFNACRIL